MFRININMLRRLFNKRISKIKQKYSERGIRSETDANFFGVESHGKMQIRGNGILLLTETDLVFGMFKPTRDFTIPLSKVEKIDLVQSHLGKSVFRPLLKVHFTNEKGHPDSVAWWVANPTEWKVLLET